MHPTSPQRVQRLHLCKELFDQFLQSLRRSIAEIKFECVQSTTLVLRAIGDDRKKSGRCDLTVAREKFINMLGSDVILQKNSPYTKFFRLQ